MWRGCVCGLIAAALAGASGLAQLKIENIELGFNGRFFPGTFTPIAVTISSAAIAQNFTLEVSQEIREERRAVERLRVPVSLAPGTRKSISFDFPISSISAPLHIKLIAGNQELARSAIEVRELWSEAPLSLGIAVAHVPPLELIDLEKLPKRWTSYEGVGRIFWGRADPVRLNTEQRQALQGWLVRGGELIILSGENWYEQASPQGWWAQLLPITDGSVVRREFNGQEIFWLEGNLRAGARVTLTYQGRPLVWERPVGRGTVVLVAVATLPKELKLSELSRRQTAEDDLVIVGALGALTIPFPSRELISVLLILFVFGVGLSGMFRWRRTPLGVGLAALIVSGVLLSYQNNPEFSSEKYSLDIGIVQIWSKEPFAWERSWYGIFFRRSRDERLLMSADIVGAMKPSRQEMHSPREIVRGLTLSGDWQIGFHSERDSVSFFKAERLVEPFVHFAITGSTVRVSNRAPVALQDVIAYSGNDLYMLGTIPAQTGVVRPLRERISKTEWINTLTPERRRIWQQWGHMSSEMGLIGWIEDMRASPIHPAPGESRTVLRLVLAEGD